MRLGNGSSYKIDKELLTGIGKTKLLERESTHAVIYSHFELSELGKENYPPIILPENLVKDEESLLHTAASRFILDAAFPPFQDFLSSISIYRDFRTDKDASIRQSTVTRFEKCVEPDGQNLISVLHTLYTGDRDFKADINSAMRAAFGDDFDELVFPPAADQRIQLRIRWKSLKREQSAADLSDGTLRFLFLLTVLANPNPPPVIAIDEPETGLHPSMMPIIAEFAQDAATRTQVIFTTHSPQFLDAFTEAQPTTTVAQLENGETVLHTLPKEELEYWLKEYSMGALFRSGTLEQMG
jgi:predicted ATPase